MPKKLFFDLTGYTGSPVALSPNSHRLEQFTSSYTGKIVEIVVAEATANGNVKHNFYTDFSDAPDSLIVANDSGSAISIGDNTISVTPFDAVSGTKYWVGVNGDVSGVVVRDTISSLMLYFTTSTYSTFTAPASISSYSSTSGAAILLGAYGWELPTVTSVTSVSAGSASTITGTDFMPTQGTGKVEFCTNSDYTGTKYDVTETSWSDTSVEFIGPYLTDGTYYVFVTTDLGIRNETGYQITLSSVYTDYALGATATPTGITWDDGLTFDSGSSVVTVADQAALRMTNALTVFAAGDMGVGYIVEKGSNYSVALTTFPGTGIMINGSLTAVSDILSATSITVTFLPGSTPDIYLDGEYRTTGGVAITLAPGTDDLLIGNTSGGGSEFEGTLKRLSVYNRILAPEEIRLLHYSAALGDATI